jgi:hypothetical protein
MANMKKSKVDKTPKRKVPEGFEFPRNKRTVPNPPGVPRTPASGTKKNMPKVAGAKPGAKKLMAKTLTGPAAVEALQRRVSPAGVKKAESGAKKAIDKKYPGLYKKSK